LRIAGWGESFNEGASGALILQVARGCILAAWVSSPEAVHVLRRLRAGLLGVGSDDPVLLPPASRSPKV